MDEGAEGLRPLSLAGRYGSTLPERHNLRTGNLGPAYA